MGDSRHTGSLLGVLENLH